MLNVTDKIPLQKNIKPFRCNKTLNFTRLCQIAEETFNNDGYKSRSLNKRDVGTLKNKSTDRPSSSLSLFRTSNKIIRPEVNRINNDSKSQDNKISREILQYLKSENHSIRTEGMKKVAAVCHAIQNYQGNMKRKSDTININSSVETMRKKKEEIAFAKNILAQMLDEGLLDICLDILRSFDGRFEIRYYVDKMIFELICVSNENRLKMIELNTMEIYYKILEEYNDSQTRANESAIISISIVLAGLIHNDKCCQARFKEMGGIGLCCSLFVKLGKLKCWSELIALTHLIAQVLKDRPDNIKDFIYLNSLTKVTVGNINDKLSYPSDNIISKIIGTITPGTFIVDSSLLANYSFLANTLNLNQPSYVERYNFSLNGLGVPYVFIGIVEYPELVTRIYISEFALRLFISSMNLNVEEKYINGMFSSNMVQKAALVLKYQEMYRDFNIQVSKYMRRYAHMP